MIIGSSSLLDAKSHSPDSASSGVTMPMFGRQTQNNLFDSEDLRAHNKRQNRISERQLRQSRSFVEHENTLRLTLHEMYGVVRY